MAARGAILAFGAAVMAVSSPSAAQAPRPSDEATARWLSQAIGYVNGEFRRIEQLPNPTCDQTTVALVNLMTYYRDRQDLFPEALVASWEERVARISRVRCSGAGEHQAQAVQPLPSPQSPGQHQLESLLAQARAAAAEHLAASLRCDRAAMAAASQKVDQALDRALAIVNAAREAGEFSTVPLSEAQVVSATIFRIFESLRSQKPKNCPETMQQQPQISPLAPQPQETLPLPAPKPPLPPEEGVSAKDISEIRWQQVRADIIERELQNLQKARANGDCFMHSEILRALEAELRRTQLDYPPEQIGLWWERLERARDEPCQPRSIQQPRTSPPPRVLNPLNILGGGARQQAPDDGGNPINRALNIFGDGNRQSVSEGSAPSANDPRAEPDTIKRQRVKARSKRDRHRDRCDQNKGEVPVDCPKR